MATAARGRCNVCQTRQILRADGRLARHYRKERGSFTAARCPGTGELPASEPGENSPQQRKAGLPVFV